MASDVIGYRAVLIATQLALSEVEGSFSMHVTPEREWIHHQETV